MIPVMQVHGSTLDGLPGDCHSAAIASILELPLAAVPYFNEGGASEDDFQERVDRYLRSQGIGTAGFRLFQDLNELLDAMSVVSRGVYYILGGMSPRGRPHSVVCWGGEIVHDPYPGGGGLVAPLTTDGVSYYHVTILTRYWRER